MIAAFAYEAAQIYNSSLDKSLVGKPELKKIPWKTCISVAGRIILK
jgi:hypothetical protein